MKESTFDFLTSFPVFVAFIVTRSPRSYRTPSCCLTRAVDFRTQLRSEIMAHKFVIRPSLAFQSIYRCKQPIKFCKQIVIRSVQTQTVEDVPAKSFNDIPGPKGLPVIGTFIDYVRDQGQGVRGYTRMHVMQQLRVQQYGEIYREKILNHETVTISNPDDVEFLFRNEGKYPVREPVFPLWMKYKEERNQEHGVFSL